MKKRITAACMAVVALTALALLPSPALANPVLTHPTGTVLPVGTKVTGTNIGETKLTTPLGNITCSTFTLTGTVHVNSTASGFDIEVTGFTEGGTGLQAVGEPHTECTSWTGGVSVTPNPPTNGLPWCIEGTTNTDEFKIRGGGCTSPQRPTRIIYAFTSIGNCVYQRSSAATGTITTDIGPTDATFHLSEQEWTKFEGSALCPSTAKADLSFTLETHTVNPEPLYISS